MKENLVAIQNLGMSKDTSISSLKTDLNTGIDYAYTNYNIRLTANDDNTLFSITNEKGTSFKSSITGKLMGHCKLGEYLVIFVQESVATQSSAQVDAIYRIDPNFTVNKLYEGDLSFNLDHPIEAVGYYETAEVQKVYWVDGINQNRFINIADVEVNGVMVAPNYTSGTKYQFDFQGHLKSTLDVTVAKTYSKAGYFLPGTIQYFITYYNKFGVESCIIWNSDLQYTSLSTRGAKADEAVYCAFDFKINNIDTDYEYLRIYSVYRSNINSTPEAKLVTAIKIEDNTTVNYSDYGNNGSQFNAQDMQYIGGQNVIANTLDHKQDTLFLGDITINSTLLSAEIKAELNKLIIPVNLQIFDTKGQEGLNISQFQKCSIIGFNYKRVDDENPEGGYEYKFQLNKSQKEIAGFKKGEFYRFSIQFQSETGEWTPAHWIGDSYCSLAPIFRKEVFQRQTQLARTDQRGTALYMRALVVNTNSYYYTTQRTEELNTNSAIYKVTKGSNGLVDGVPVIVRWFINNNDGNTYYTDKLDGNIYAEDTIYSGTLTNLTEIANEDTKKALIQNYTTDLIKRVTRVTDLEEIAEVVKFYEDAGDIITSGTEPVKKWEVGNYISNAIVTTAFSNALKQLLTNAKFINYRLLVAETSVANRRIVTQGIINPTMFNYLERFRNKPFSISSWQFRPRLTLMLNRHYDCMPQQNTDYGEIQGIMNRDIPGFDPRAITDTYNAYYFVFAVNYLAGYRVGYGLVYYNTANCNYYGESIPTNRMSNSRLKTRRSLYKHCMDSISTYSALIQAKINEYWNRVKNDSTQYDSSSNTFLNLNDRQAVLAITLDRALAQELSHEDWCTDYQVTGAKVVSCGYNRGMTKIYKVQSYILSTMKEDLTSYGEQIILSEAMLPSEGQYYDACWIKSSLADIFAWIGLAIAVAAAVVATVFSAGAASGALVGIGIALGAVEASVVSAVSSVCAVAAIAGSAGMAAYARSSEDMKAIDKELAIKGFVSLNDHDLSGRQQFADNVESSLKVLFDKSSVSGPWGGIEAITDRIQRRSGLRHGHIGQDANAYAMGGTFDTTSLDERDLYHKQNLFFTDESIVTLNSPDMEEVSIQNMINDSEALQLNLVGVIPVGGVTATYDMKTQTNGLANSAAVMRDGDINSSNKVEGLLNGYLYQDCVWGELVSTSAKYKQVQASANVARYKIFMWHRDVSWSLYTQDCKINDVFGEAITEAPAKPKRKVFANFRYAPGTKYHQYYPMSIDTPKIFNSDQQTICPIMYGGYKKYYYGNVDDIITTEKNYTLITDECKDDDLSNPNTWGFHRKSDTKEVDITIKDPISLRYKQTPHTVIPLRWKDPIVSTILPYMESSESLANMYDMYDNYIPTIDILGIDEVLDKQCTHIWGLDQKLKLDNNRCIFGSIVSSGVEYKIVSNHSPEVNNTATGSFLFRAFKLFTLCQSAEILEVIYTQLNNYKLNGIICDNIDSYPVKVDNAVSVESFVEYLESNAPYILKLMSSFRKSSTEENYSFYLNDSYNKFYMRAQTLGVYKQYLVDISNFIVNSTEVYANIRIYEVTSNIFTAQNILTSGSKSAVIPAMIIKRINPITEFLSIESDYYPNVQKSPSFFTPTVDTNILYWDDVDAEPDKSNVNTESYKANTWNQDSLDWNEESSYLFMGELVKKEFNYQEWNGGYLQYALQLLTWNVASGVTPIGTLIDKTWGDTYYQRWECQKTYPFTEDDPNSVVDILSCMVETHTNIDGRCDINRGTENLVNDRPTNFNLINPAYSQSDNFFSYQILDEKFEKTHFENEVVWSLTKNPLDDVDNWTNLLETNAIYLDGQYGAIRKILNVGDVLYAFQDRALDVINYNEKTAISTESGLPLQVSNTGKVTGYTKTSDKIGCHNKYSINSNSSGVYFIDDYNKALISISRNEGLKTISSISKFSVWFNKAIDGTIWGPNNQGAFKTSYDEITHDLYIINNLYCLVYNTLLSSFTSFMDYQSVPVINNVLDKSVLLHQDSNSINLYQMFTGDYNYLLNQWRGYSMEYRVSPSPSTDNMFTNYEFVADWAKPTSHSDDYDQLGTPTNSYNPKTVSYTDSDFTTFDKVEAWNEYQHGEMQIVTKRIGSYKLKPKFRVWRGDIPRDGSSLTAISYRGDRMRNPWIHLKFTKVAKPNENSKMTFHNLMVTYYN